MNSLAAVTVPPVAKQIVMDQDMLTGFKSIGMHFNGGGAVFQLVCFLFDGVRAAFPLCGLG